MFGKFQLCAFLGREVWEGLRVLCGVILAGVRYMVALDFLNEFLML